MSLLINIKALRDSFSANEKRIADFILENSQFMRDYSSQQLASAVRVSQSSIVKFSQKLGCKGYPDLKMAINESVVTARLSEPDKLKSGINENELLQQVNKAASELLTQWASVNQTKHFEDSAKILASANKTILLSSGLGLCPCETLARKLFGFGKACQVISSDTPSDLALLSSLAKNDALLVIEETEFPLSLHAAVQKLHALGVHVVLVSKLGQSKLANIAENHLLWLTNKEEDALNSFQTDISIAAIFATLTKAIDDLHT